MSTKSHVNTLYVHDFMSMVAKPLLKFAVELFGMVSHLTKCYLLKISIKSLFYGHYPVRPQWHTSCKFVQTMSYPHGYMAK